MVTLTDRHIAKLDRTPERGYRELGNLTAFNRVITTYGKSRSSSSWLQALERSLYATISSLLIPRTSTCVTR